jgi:hypothetical protein
MKFNVQYREPIRPYRLREKLHMRFFRSSATLFAITRSARTDYVFPSGSSTLAARHDMIKGCLLGCQLFRAILTRKVISS